MGLLFRKLFSCEESDMWYWKAKKKVWKQVVLIFLQWKKVGGFSIYLVNFGLLKGSKLINIAYLEIENLERNFDLGAIIWCNNRY